MMDDSAPAGGKKDWFSGTVSPTALLVLLAVPCLCLAAFCLVPLVGSGCSPADLFFRSLWKPTPELPQPGGTLALAVTQAQGSAGGVAEGLYATEQSPEQLVEFYRRNGATCNLSHTNELEFGNLVLHLPAAYWDCDVPAQPWSRGTVVVAPQAGYVNALKAEYDNSPRISNGVAGRETDLTKVLSQFYGPPPFPAGTWPDGGAVLQTSVFWCDPL